MTDLGEIYEGGALHKPLAAMWLTFPEESGTDGVRKDSYSFRVTLMTAL